MPDWRSPIFYYRRVRKIGLAEGLAYLFVIVTVFQYCIYWAHYWEKKFTLREAINTQIAKKAGKKSGKKSADEMKALLEEQEIEILGPKPTFWDLLPFQSVRLVKHLAISIPKLPWTLLAHYNEMKEKKAEEERLKQEEEAEVLRREEEKKERKERKKERKRILGQYEERTGNGSSDTETEMMKKPEKKEDIFKQPANANQIWTDVELAKLAKLIKKYPQGTLDRWERIADIMERLPWEVTKMAKKIKDNAYMVPVSQKSQGITGLEAKNSHLSDDLMEATTNLSNDDENSEEDEDSGEDSDNSDYGAYSLATKADFEPIEVKTKVKTRKNEEENPEAPQAEDVWSQAQQKAFEMALVQFPKGATERWERIANKVPGKTKDQCIARFKTLAEMVKKKREEAAA